MATIPAKTKEVIKISKESQTSLLGFLTKVLEHHKASSKELNAKMDIIDRAYARYKGTADTPTDGVDNSRNTACDVFATDDKVTPPIVVSQVDSFVAYLADVFLSGYPLFPVVSTPATRKDAEALETLMDDHAILGAYPRHLLLFIREAVKYNYAGLEVDWDTITRFTSVGSILSSTGKATERSVKYFNRIRRIDPRNIIRDTSVLPCDLAEHGDYGGYVEMLSTTALRRYLVKMHSQGFAFNIEAALNSAGPGGTSSLDASNFTVQPSISEYISAEGYYNSQSGVDWDAYAEGNLKKKSSTPSYGNMYEKVVLYARIIPSQHGIVSPAPNTPQIWRLVLINGQVLVAAHRVISAFDLLPILLGQPQEDGFGVQTQSVAESEIPFQDAAEKLFNIRFSAARRAVSDRALYNDNYIKSSDINSKAAAPKIPVNINPLTPISLDSVYKSIPFDMRGTETTLGDAQAIVQFSRELHGLNNARTGQFQRGNKSVQEWNDVQSGSENRLRLPALALEFQVFQPMKSIMTLNIMQFGEDAEIVSQKTGDVVKVDIARLRAAALSFRVADGFTPKSKMASTEMLNNGLQIIGNSPILQQSYGAYLPAMFSHLMSLGGVRGLEEYDPQYAARQEQGAQNAAATQGIQGAAIQAQGLPGAPVNPSQPGA